MPTKKQFTMTRLVVTVNDNAMLPQLRTAIRQLRGVVGISSLRTESKSKSVRKIGKLRQELIERLVLLSQLEDGWDGADSKAIDSRCVTKLRASLNRATDKQLTSWMLFPDARGFLYFDYTGEHCSAGITMTADSLIYFIQKGDVLEKNDGIPFSSSNLISILKSVNA